MRAQYLYGSGPMRVLHSATESSHTTESQSHHRSVWSGETRGPGEVSGIRGVRYPVRVRVSLLSPLTSHSIGIVFGRFLKYWIYWYDLMVWYDMMEMHLWWKVSSMVNRGIFAKRIISLEFLMINLKFLSFILWFLMLWFPRLLSDSKSDHSNETLL